MQKAKRVVVVSNGEMRNRRFHRRMFKTADLLIAADGGANSLVRFGVTPDYVIGDFDSIKKNVLQKLAKNNTTTVIYDPDQDKTDTQLAIALAETFTPKEIILAGSIGSRIDHTLANVFCLTDPHITMVDDKNEIHLVEKKIELRGKKNETISVIALTRVTGLSYRGLRWGLKNKTVPAGWSGVCNVMTGRKAVIRLTKGKLLVMRAKD